GHVALAVVVRDLVDRGQQRVAAEVLRSGGAQVRRHWVVPVARALRVHVHVDGGDRGEVPHGDTVSSPSCSDAPAASRSPSEPGGPISDTLTGNPLRLPTPDGSATAGKPVQFQ